MEKNKKFIIYQITNLINYKIYIGAHITFDINDRYMGSSNYLKRDIKEFGRKNFKKEIIHIFDNKKDMLNKEAEIVNKEFCHQNNTYNRIIGGLESFSNQGMVTVNNPDGGYMNVYIDDPRYLSGELLHLRNGKKLSKEHKNAWHTAMKIGANNDEVKNKISNTLKTKYDAGEKLGAMGCKLSEEVKKEHSRRRIEEVISGKDKSCRKVGQYDKEGNFVKEWNSMGEAVREGGYNKMCIITACKNETKTHKKHYWKYI